MSPIPPRPRDDASNEETAPASTAEQVITGGHDDTLKTATQDGPSDANAAATTSEQGPDSTSQKEHHEKPQTLPKPLLRFQIHELSHPAVRTFLTTIDTSTAVQDAIDTVCRILYNADIPNVSSPSSNSSASTSTTAPTPSPKLKPLIPQIRSVTLILDPMDGVAYTTGIQLDEAHKEIHVSLSYIQHVGSRPAPGGKGNKDTSHITHELLGVLVHEMVHTLQNNGLGTAPGGLIEGVADYVRLKAGLGAAHWKRPTQGGKVAEKWDVGYERTAFFLEWLEERDARNGKGKGGEGLVVRMNEWLGRNRWEDGKVFWEELVGVGIEGLWEEYLRKVGEEEKGEGEGVGVGVDKDEDEDEDEDIKEAIRLSLMEDDEARLT